jgi:hypothetical protein
LFIHPQTNQNSPSNDGNIGKPTKHFCNPSPIRTNGRKNFMCNTIKNEYKNAYAAKLATIRLRYFFLLNYYNKQTDAIVKRFAHRQQAEETQVLNIDMLHLHIAAFS